MIAAIFSVAAVVTALGTIGAAGVHGKRDAEGTPSNKAYVGACWCALLAIVFSFVAGRWSL